MPTYRSAEGRAIRVYSFGGGDRTVLLMAGVHGDEKRGVRVVRSVLRRLREMFKAQGSKVKVDGRIVVMPLANPDGYKANTRQNARGIDINRNFPTKDHDGGPEAPGGTEPASEPETQAILDLVERVRPDVIITLHQSLACVNYNGDSALPVAERMSSVCDLPVMGDIGYPCPGSMGTYYGWERELPVITLELPKRGADLGPVERSVLDALGIR